MTSNLSGPPSFSCSVVNSRDAVLRRQRSVDASVPRVSKANLRHATPLQCQLSTRMSAMPTKRSCARKILPAGRESVVRDFARGHIEKSRAAASAFSSRVHQPRRRARAAAAILCRRATPRAHIGDSLSAPLDDKLLLITNLPKRGQT